MKVVLLTVGPLGALRPMLALAVELRAAGHEVVLGSHENYRVLVEEWGVGFSPIAPDSAGLASDRSRDSQFSAAGNPIKYFNALRIEAGELSTAAVEVFNRSLELCRECDVILYHAHMHVAASIAEHLGITAIQTYNTPVTPTSAFPSYIRLRHSKKTTPFSNRMSFFLRDIVTWLPYRGTINKWRHDKLGMPPIGFMGPYRALDSQHSPLLYSISPSMLPCPNDWPDWVHLTGYWQLPKISDYVPPDELVQFLESGAPPICIGFGSMSYGDASSMTSMVVEAVTKCNCRAILLSGWQGMKKTSLPDSIYMCEDVPHSWLFERVSASVNAGGIGTLSAALQAGLPSLVVPFGGDNVFWGWQAANMGVGPDPIPVKEMTADLLTERLKDLVGNAAYIKVAQKTSVLMQKENGTAEAVKLIENYAVKKET